MQPILTSLCVLVVAVTMVTSQMRNLHIPPGALVEIEFEFVNPPNSGRTAGQARTMGGGMNGVHGQMGSMGQPMSMVSGMSGRQGQPMSMGPMAGVQGQAQPMGNGFGGMMSMMSPVHVMMRTMAPPGGMMSHMTSQTPSPQQQPGSQGQGQGQMPPNPAPVPPRSALQETLNNMVNMALTLRRMHGMNIPTPPMEEPCPCSADCCSMPSEPRRVLPVFEIPMTMHAGCCGCIDCPISLSHLVTSMIQAAQNTPASNSNSTPPPEAK